MADETDEPFGAGAAGLRASIGALLAELLDCDRVAEHVRFSALGLTSLGGLRLINAIRDELGIELDLASLLRHPTVAELAQACAAAEAAAPAPVPASPVEGAHPLSAIQQSLHALHLLAEGGDSPGLLWVMTGQGECPSAEAGRAAFLRVVERHEPLRTAFRMVGGAAAQFVLPLSEAEADFAFTDLADHPRPLAELAFLYRDMAARPFELAAGRVARLHLVRLGRGEWLALASAHHIVADSFTARTIAGDFARALAGKPLEPFPFQYKDHVHWLEGWCAGAEGVAAADHWRQAIGGLPAFAPPRGSLATAFRETGLGLKPPRHLSLSAWLLAALAVALEAWDGRSSGAIGLAVSTRDLPGLTEQIGPFVNTLPLRIVPGGEEAAAIAERIEPLVERALAHKRLPVERIMTAVAAQGPLFDVGLSIEERPDPDPLEEALRARCDWSEATAVPLLVIVMHHQDRARLRIRYQVEAYSRQAIDDLLAILTSLISDPDKSTLNDAA